MCIYTKNCLDADEIKPISTAHNLEFVWLKVSSNYHNYCICLCYHPPKPIYSVHELTQDLTENLTFFVGSNVYDVFALVGDLNNFNYNHISESFDFSQIIDKPTRINKTLDVFLTNRPELFSVTVARSLLNSDHMLIYINCSNTEFTDHNAKSNQCKKKFKCYNRDNESMQRLINFMDNYSWNGLLNCIDNSTVSVDDAFADFINIVHFILDNVVGYRTATIREKDPPYITPYVKLLLKRRNKLMRAGRIDDANSLSTKIGNHIANIRANLLKKASQKDTKKLWQLVKSSCSLPKSQVNPSHPSITANDLNLHFANVATDSDYDEIAIAQVLQTSNEIDDSLEFIPYSSDIFAIILSKVKRTSPGPDSIPYWFYKTCSAQLSIVMSKLVNYSITKRKVPTAWLTAHITPIPKTNPVNGPADFRPISVTSIFSRLTEKLVVRDFLLPCITPQFFSDQYAFKPTGSTTCALIDLTYNIQMMLEKCKYVRCVFIDFSKAFDVVDHRILLEKLLILNVPNFVVSWIKSFLTSRTHSTKFNGQLSASATINRSIVQGSGLGPILFIMFAYDLITLDDVNYLLKYADDVTLLNPENSTTSAEDEMANIINWANQNKMFINMIKTKEMVFHRPNPRHTVFPNELVQIQRVHTFKLLGVYLKPDLNFNEHVSHMVTQCNQRLYLLAQLKKQGLGINQSDLILQAIILSRIRYALPMYYRFLTTDMINRINAIFQKAKKWNLTNTVYTIIDIAEEMQINLFQLSKRSNHCLNHLYIVKTHDQDRVTLRPRGHKYELPLFKYDFTAKSFVVNSLFKFR